MILSARQDVVFSNNYSEEEDVHAKVRDALDLPNKPGTTLYKYKRSRFVDLGSETGSERKSPTLTLDLFNQLSASQVEKNKKKSCKQKCCSKKPALLLAESDSEDELDHLEMKLNVFFARE